MLVDQDHVAIRIGDEKLLWDPVNLKVTNSEEATALLHYPYRQGWSL